MGSDIIIRPTLLSIQRSWDTPLTVKSLGDELKDRIVNGTHTLGRNTTLPDRSLTLLGVLDLHLLTLQGLGKVIDIVELTGESSNLRRDELTVTVEIGTSESADEDTTILTVHMGTDIIALVVAILTILIEDRNFVKIEIDNRIQGENRSSTNSCILCSLFGSHTNFLPVTLTREHRANKITLICHKL